MVFIALPSENVAVTAENSFADTPSSALYKIVMSTYPDIALPNIRNVSDNKGAHMEIKLIGKNNGTGSIYLLKYLNLLYLIAVA